MADGRWQMAESKKQKAGISFHAETWSRGEQVFSFQFSVFRVQGSGFRTIGSVDWTGILTTKTQRH